MSERQKPLQQACGDIEIGTVAVICECGKIRQYGRPCGFSKTRDPLPIQTELKR